MDLTEKDTVREANRSIKKIFNQFIKSGRRGAFGDRLRMFGALLQLIHEHEVYSVAKLVNVLAKKEELDDEGQLPEWLLEVIVSAQDGQFNRALAFVNGIRERYGMQKVIEFEVVGANKMFMVGGSSESGDDEDDDYSKKI